AAAGVAGRGGEHPRYLPELALGAPETAQPELRQLHPGEIPAQGTAMDVVDVVQRQRGFAAGKQVLRARQALLVRADAQQGFQAHVGLLQAGSRPGSASGMGPCGSWRKPAARNAASASGRAGSGTQTLSTPNSGSSPAPPSRFSPNTKAGIPASSSTCRARWASIRLWAR